jgi:hypothetical protein
MDGPFFRKDPALTFRQNVRVMMDAVAAEGEKDVRAQYQAGEARRRPISTSSVGRSISTPTMTARSS